MKRIFLSLCGIAVMMSVTSTLHAQKSKSNDNNSEEIIIRKNGGKDKKITVEINGNDILINGKPLSEFKDEGVTIKTFHNKDGERLNQLLGGNSGNAFLYTPGAAGRTIGGWNDSNWGEKRPLLGITTEKSDNGVKITDVNEGSAASKAGLKEGDIITSVGGKKISEPDDVVSAVRSHKPKDEIKIQYERNGKAGEVMATLGESKALSRAFSFSNSGNNEHLFDVQPMAPFSGSSNGLYKMLINGNHKLGIRIEDLDEGDGVKITNVEERSAAEKAGLKKDDIITEIDGKKVKDVNDARGKLMEAKDKMSYSLKAKRNGSEMTFDIKIPKRKNNAEL